MVKGDNKYPRTMAATLHFLQYHNLRNNVSQSGRSRYTLAQEGEEEKPRGGDKIPNAKRWLANLAVSIRMVYTHTRRYTPGRNAQPTSGELTRTRL